MNKASNRQSLLFNTTIAFPFLKNPRMPIKLFLKCAQFYCGSILFKISKLQRGWIHTCTTA